jgi:hypothetical protein
MVSRNELGTRQTWEVGRESLRKRTRSAAILMAWAYKTGHLTWNLLVSGTKKWRCFKMGWIRGDVGKSAALDSYEMVLLET